jgi:signal peptidase I
MIDLGTNAYASVPVFVLGRDPFGGNMAGLTFRKRKKRINYTIIKEAFVWIAEMILAFVIACVLVVNFGVMTSNVGQSMEPTISSGEKVLTNNLIYKMTSPKRGDLVVFKPNGNENSHYYIKRVVGLPGERIQIIDGFIYINGEVLVEDIKFDKMDYAGTAEEELRLGEDEFFVLGDNRNASEDSRNAEIGNIRKQDITSKAWFNATMGDHFGFIE